MDEQEITGKLQEAGFDVTEPVELDLSDVREERVLLPPANNVRLRIRKAAVWSNQDNTYRGLNISFSVEDGITAGSQTKFKGAVIFERICYYADPVVYNKDYFKRKQHLVSLKQLVKAIGGDVNKIVVNDDFLKRLEGCVVAGDIRQVPNSFTAKDGTQVNTTINTIVRFRPVAAEDQV